MGRKINRRSKVYNIHGYEIDKKEMLALIEFAFFVALIMFAYVIGQNNVLQINEMVAEAKKVCSNPSVNITPAQSPINMDSNLFKGTTD